MESTWKQVVADAILDIVQETGDVRFAINDLYGRLPVIQQRFPGNLHPKEKIRQTLQFLRDDGLLVFAGGGNYELDLSFGDLEVVPEAPMSAPRYTKRVAMVRLRNTLLVSELKRRHDFECQICKGTLYIDEATRYAEGHHLWPLGRPYDGPDVEENIVIVCPNDHVLLDRLAIAIEPENGRIIYRSGGLPVSSEGMKFWDGGRSLGREFIQHHYLRYKALTTK